MKSEPRQQTAFFLSIIIVVLALISSVGGLFLDELYRDNEFVTLSLVVNDFVTLVIAIPLMVISMALTRRGSIHAELVWLGMLDYMLYNFAYYLFGAAFNWFFLLYVSLFTLSIFALIFGLVNIDAAGISQSFRENTPVKWISGYMIFIAIGLSAVYIMQIFAFIINGVLPPIIELVDHPTNVVFALDLSLLVPVLVLGGIWLWKRRPWGYVLTGMSLVKGATYTLILTSVAIWSARAGNVGAATELPFWGFITITFTIICAIFYINLQSKGG